MEINYGAILWESAVSNSKHFISFVELDQSLEKVHFLIMSAAESNLWVGDFLVTNEIASNQLHSCSVVAEKANHLHKLLSQCL